MSAIPIALLANTTRITLTGVFHELLGSGAAESSSHDLAGWLTLPLSLAALYVESRLLTLLFIESSDATAVAAEPVDHPASVVETLADSRQSRSIPAVVAMTIIVATATYSRI